MPEQLMNEYAMQRTVEAMDESMTTVARLNQYRQELLDTPDKTHHFMYRLPRENENTGRGRRRYQPAGVIPVRQDAEQYPEAYGDYIHEYFDFLDEEDKSHPEDDQFDIVRAAWHASDAEHPIPIPNRFVARVLESEIDLHERLASQSAFNIERQYRDEQYVQQLIADLPENYTLYTSDRFTPVEPEDLRISAEITRARRIEHLEALHRSLEGRKQLVASVLGALGINQTPLDLTQEQRLSIIDAAEAYAATINTDDNDFWEED
ncbi:MAG: hypothetical protein JWL89_614 [Candidatus Saccharibacteria bacterium]|nr:hypothetical protein [Candidatus Saccharibacteria bacterium]